LKDAKHHDHLLLTIVADIAGECLNMETPRKMLSTLVTELPDLKDFGQRLMWATPMIVGNGREAEQMPVME
jgi:hypothetical protein